MTPLRLLTTAIVPALGDLAAYKVRDSREARIFLVAVALQETGLLHRRQVGSKGGETGPAMSFWQFEKTGGCREVLQNHATAVHMRCICAAYNVSPSEAALWEAMRYQDIVAAAAARCLLFTFPGALPQTADEGWDQYIATWRPGKPHRKTWDNHWATATETVGKYHA